MFFQEVVECMASLNAHVSAFEYPVKLYKSYMMVSTYTVQLVLIRKAAHYVSQAISWPEDGLNLSHTLLLSLWAKDRALWTKFAQHFAFRAYAVIDMPVHHSYTHVLRHTLFSRHPSTPPSGPSDVFNAQISVSRVSGCDTVCPPWSPVFLGTSTAFGDSHSDAHFMHLYTEHASSVHNGRRVR